MPNNLIEPWLPDAGICMLYGTRGVGKSWVVVGLGFAVACGVPFLEYRVTRSARVLYVDGEMRPGDQVKRYVALAKGMGLSCYDEKLEQNFLTITHAQYEAGLPDFADPASGAWDALQGTIDETKPKLVILDNLSSLARSGDENEASSWHYISEKLLGLRRQELCVLLVHHAKKPGEGKTTADQRGTSKREDILDTVVRLNPREAASSETETHGQWEFRKHRTFGGEKPFDYVIGPGESGGVTLKKGNPQLEEVEALLASGQTLRKVAAKVGIPKSTLSDHIKRNRTTRTPRDGHEQS